MKKIATFLVFVFFLFSCSDRKNIPDVSDIDVNIDVLRFDQDLFTADTNNMKAGLDELQKKYPLFVNNYLDYILGLPPQPDTIIARLKQFIRDYRSVYDSVQRHFSSLQPVRQEITQALRFVKYYFPSYKLPDHLITYIGPMEGYANVITPEGLAVGLQLYLGKDFPVYHTDYINAVYPEYQSRRFEPQYIVVNCIKNIIDDIYPGTAQGTALAYQMVEAGKRLYVLDRLLPEAADSLKTGYMQQQLEGCYANEGLIWNHFIVNDLLYETDPALTRDYMSDGPKTDLLGEASPGFIGQFVGWQIVKKWMSVNNQKTLPELLNTPARQIFEEAKYKPR